MQIIVDSRERLPLFIRVVKGLKTGNLIINERFPEIEFEIKKLDEGDYAFPDFEMVVFERKSPNDLYGSIIKGHNRFRDELFRCKTKGKKMYIMVECSKQDFLSHNYNGGWYRDIKGKQLAKIISTIEERYHPIFVWCDSREIMESLIIGFYVLLKKEVDHAKSL